MSKAPTSVQGHATGKQKPRRKLSMTNWYNPGVLVPTAIRVTISTVFGELADRREAIAASNAIEPQPIDDNVNYSDEKGDFWFDFLADTGDGWNSTYAMARLLSEDVVKPTGTDEELPRGRILFLGGDQVYPTASRKEYDDRFLHPFDEAYQPTGAGPRWEAGAHDLYAVPGNHDWYDGLNSFFGLFCRRRVKPKVGIGFPREGRVIAGRRTHQTRSYFAVKLPAGWWLWGTDSQLAGYIDQPQIDYFRHVAHHWMEPESKVILCVGQPSWAYVEEDEPELAFSNFSYLERIAGAERDDQNQPKNHQLKLVLTGDSHHYARYVEGERHYVTCGGGGAFLHPTHHLKSRRFHWDYPPPGQAFVPGSPQHVRDFQIATTPSGAEAVYPGRAKSRQLTFWNLAFAAKNYWFTVTLAVAYGLFHWLLDFNARMTGASSLGEALRTNGLFEAMLNYWKLVTTSPAAAILILIAFGAYYYAADARKVGMRLLMGGGHALAQGSVVTAVICLVLQNLPRIGAPLEILIAAIVAAVASATTYGLYLLVWVLATGRHWNEAFSSFAHRGFKSMLRLRIAADGTLTVFPVGLTQVPRDRGKTPRNPPLRPHLIEGPIIIS